MILLWGVPGDSPLDAVSAALKRTGAEVRLLDQRHAAEMYTELAVTPDGTLSGRFVDANGEIDVTRIGAAYIRPSETTKACDIGEPNHPALLRAVTVDTTLVSWADLSKANVVNRPEAMAANNSKPYQLALIASCGFAVPDTLVATDDGAVRQFAEHHGSVIYKSVSGVRSIVARLHQIHSVTLADVANCPTQFQQYIPGTDVRVHVVGNTVFATGITSAADDYRYASRMGADLIIEPVVLPAEVADKCRAMVHGMGLHLAGIDFRLTPAGMWYCFEVNPSPGFTFFEAATGQPIAAAVADLLLQLDRSVQ